MKKTRIGFIVPILGTVFFVGLGILLAIFSVYSKSDVDYYADALSVAEQQLSGDHTPKVVAVDGKTAMETNASFDKLCYVNQRYSYTDSSVWLTAAKSMWDTTGIQLYNLTLTAPTGDGTGIMSSTDAERYCHEYISQLPNSSIAIVQYEFIGDQVNGQYIDVYDGLFYGDEVLEYLSSADMEMISYVLRYSYDLFPDYSTRETKMWETIGYNISNGYNRNMYNGTEKQFTDWDVRYYQEELGAAQTRVYVFGTMCLFCSVIAGVIFYIGVILRSAKLKADIAVQKAHADKIILESDVSRIPDDADDLTDKYLKDID